MLSIVREASGIGIASAVAVYMTMGERRAAPAPAPIVRSEDDTVVEFDRALVDRFSGSRKDFEIKDAKMLGYPDGRVKLVGDPAGTPLTIIVHKGETRRVRISASEAKVSKDENYFDLTGPVKLQDSDGFWLDFFCICDDANCHLFFADDAGELFRSQTKITDFPNGFGDAVVAIQGVKETVFEGDMVYRVKGKDAYLAVVEAFGPTGNRFFRSLVAPALDGAWTPLAADWANPFAGKTNVTFADGAAWTNDISHGELVRDGYDQTLEIDPNNLQLVYQGADPATTSLDYSQIPWKIGLLTQTQ